MNLGNVMPAVYAMRARRYMHETGATARHLAMISVKAHEYGARNPNAQFQNRISIEEVMGSRMVADPLTLYMCCPTGDGAAAVIVTSEKRARELGAKPGASPLRCCNRASTRPAFATWRQANSPSAPRASLMRPPASVRRT